PGPDARPKSPGRRSAVIAAAFERVAFAHPWALLGLAFVPLAIWLLARRRQRMPRLVVPAAPAKLPASRWARLWWLPGARLLAAEAYTQCPLTLDYRVLQELLEQVKTGVIVDGTAIGNALATAVNRLRESDAKSKVIILLTDGDNNAGNISPLQAAQIAGDLGIKVFTILIGKGGRVPYPTGTDLFGRTLYEQVEIDVNPELLQQIAKSTGGTAYQATDRESLERGLSQVLDSLEKSKIYEAGGS